MKKPRGWTPRNESIFQDWYKTQAKRTGIDPNPDNPLHFYDYRSAFLAGAQPTKESGWHWPSKFKLQGHPRLIVNGVNTKTGKRVTPTTRKFR